MSFIARLKGTVEEKGRDFVVVDVGGVGYEVSVPGSTLSRIGAVGEPVALRIFTLVREDALLLYGFLTAEERDAFERLLGVTGVGPRGALSFLTHFSPGDLAAAVEARDAAALTRVKGIGRKTADRLVLELSGKLAAPAGEGYVPVGDIGFGDEAGEMLVSLGYSAQEVRAALVSVPPVGAAPVEERIKLALRALDSMRG